LPVPGGSIVSLQVRVWQMAPTWEAAATYSYPSGVGYWGKGNVFNYTLGGGGTPPAPPEDMMGMQPIVLQLVPEPGVFALAGLGLAGLMIFRRRK
ncbi:MAG: PEP-CTERM sorting domain-containing protein, partial [Verrucomicrobiae bacterium]|nr:PEP-CTERM sorting domain-containing protein [Verrucomicrobiae bacterium]MDW7979707.1 PEP-CTERM sorting domain-containing protein [Verrucomicrobiales bacterium]